MVDAATFPPVSALLLSGLLAMTLPANTPKQPAEATTEAGSVSLSNPLNDQENMIDRLVVFRGEEDFSAGELDRLRITDEGHLAIEFEPGTPGFPKRGNWFSPQVEADVPFTELLPSWNVTTPAETGVFFEVRTRDAESGEWSPWLYIGQWGRTLHWPKRTVAFDHGQVNVDILELNRPADAFQIAARLLTYDLEDFESPRVRVISVSYSARVDDPEAFAALHKPPTVDSNWAGVLPVPFTPQGDNPQEISGSTCSPTCVNMVMRFRGVEENLTRTAMSIYDREFGIFGNWNRAVAHASAHGLEGYLTRVRTWDEVRSYLSQGTPLIASIKFEEGTFSSNVMSQTNGHLIVIKGMTPEGDAIVNDPASRERGHGIVYVADELANAWFRNGGVTYVIREPEERPAQ